MAVFSTFSILDQINLSETSLKSSILIYICKWNKFVSVPSTSVPRTKNIVMKCRAVCINCCNAAVGQQVSPNTCFSCSSLFLCLEVVSAQVSLPKCHKWVISHFETKGTLFNFAVSFTNVRPLVGSYFTKIWAFFIKSTDTEQIVTKTRRVYFKLPWLRFNLFSYLDDNSLLYKLLMNDHCYK